MYVRSFHSFHTIFTPSVYLDIFAELSSSLLIIFSLSNIQLYPIIEFLISVFVFSVQNLIQIQVLTVFYLFS